MSIDINEIAGKYPIDIEGDVQIVFIEYGQRFKVMRKDSPQWKRINVKCSYCGSIYNGEKDRCDSCGSPKTDDCKYFENK